MYRIINIIKLLHHTSNRSEAFTKLFVSFDDFPTLAYTVFLDRRDI